MTKHLERIYDAMALGLLYLYLLIPLWSYLIFLGALPKIRLTLVFAVLIIPILALRVWLLVTKKRPLPDKRYALLWVLLLWITVLQIAWALNTLSQIGVNEYLSGIAFTVGAYIFVLGAETLAIQLSAHDEWHHIVWLGLTFIYVALIAMILYGITRYFFTKNQLLFLFTLHHPKRVYNYQVLADTLAILSLLMLARYGASGLLRRFAIYGVSALFLFFAYSRASVAAFLITGGLLILLQSWKDLQQRKKLLRITLGGALLFGIGMAGLSALSKNVENAGSLSLLMQRFFSTNTFHNSSFQVRIHLWDQSLPFLKSYWFRGRFMYEVVIFEKGAYAHNWLSFWLAYGVLPFLLSLTLLFGAFITAIKQCSVREWTPLACSLLLYNILMIVAARPYIWVYFWLTLALSIALLAFNNTENYEKNNLSSALE